MKMLTILLCFVGSLSWITDGEPIISNGISDWSSTDMSSSQMPSDSDQIQIVELKNQILNLQKSVVEITRSFSTLELVAKNPSIMAKIDNPFIPGVRPDSDVVSEDKTSSRVRRDVDAPISPLPTSAPNNSEQPNWNRMMGPYSWPMYSGQCFLCPAGVPGPRGPPGPAGAAGRDGRDGRDAQIGEPITQVETEPETSQPPVQIVHVNSSTSSGAIYVRWGNSECPDSAELIYAGTVGGSHYTHVGSGSNYLCLPNEPIYDEVDAANADRALLYSSEYQTSGAPTRLRAVHDQTPVCAVCRAPPGRSTKLMVPARNVCPSDKWRLEYSGYLMAERYTHKKSEFICVDRALEAEPGTYGDQNGALFYMVEGRCMVGAGMPCGPYVNGYELTCAVCTI